MPETQMHKNEILNRMKRLDRRVAVEFQNENTRIRLVIVGGSAFVLRDYITRATDDIDIIEADRRLVHLMEQYEIFERRYRLCEN